MKKLILTAIVALVLAFNSFSQTATELFATKCIEKMDAFIENKKESTSDNYNVLTITTTIPSFYDFELVMLTIKSADVYSDVMMRENWKKEDNSYSCIYTVDNNPILIGYLPNQKIVTYIFITDAMPE